MKIKSLKKLKEKAKTIMANSNDPIHNLNHVERVLDNANKIMKNLNLTEQEKESVRLACLWHDVGRITTNKPSFVWMIFFDDTISAILLWKETLKYKLFDSTGSLASRIIFCKSLGTGKLFTRIFLKKRTKILLDIVKDADTLDMLHKERLIQIMEALKDNTLSIMVYRLISWYATRLKTFKIKTAEGQKILKQIIEQVLFWLKNPEIIIWYTKKLGQKSCNKLIKKIEKILDHFTLLNLQNN